VRRRLGLFRVEHGADAGADAGCRGGVAQLACQLRLVVQQTAIGGEVLGIVADAGVEREVIEGDHSARGEAVAQGGDAGKFLRRRLAAVAEKGPRRTRAGEFGALQGVVTGQTARTV